MNSFKLDISQLKEIAEEFTERVEDGLKATDREIQCIPTHISSIKQPRDADSYVLDLGGTNVRATSVSFEDGECSVNEEQFKKAMPWNSLDKKKYLDIQASGLKSVKLDKECPLGYCFSFPAKSKLNGDAELINWTKEIIISGVEGEDVGEMLLDYIKTHYKKEDLSCSKVVVVNDTVASLIAGLVKPKVDASIGLIVGTGTNLATFMNYEDIPKLSNLAKKHDLKGSIPVNLESGNFTPSYLTEFDDEMDRKLQDHGEQRFEKAVSGAYLGYIFKEVHGDSSFDPKDGAKGISDLLNNARGVRKEYVSTAKDIYDRSAQLVSASLAGLIKLLKMKDSSIKTVRVVAEGSLFWGKINNELYYSELTRSTLELLLNELGLNDVKVEFDNIENANLIGSAIAALS